METIVGEMMFNPGDDVKVMKKTMLVGRILDLDLGPSFKHYWLVQPWQQHKIDRFCCLSEQIQRTRTQRISLIQ